VITPAGGQVMASGRQDYTRLVIGRGAYEGAVIDLYKAYTTGSIDATDTREFLPYTVPAGYRLKLSRIHISTPSGAGSYCYISVDSHTILTNYFTESCDFDFGEEGLFILEAGSTISVIVENKDEVSNYYAVWIVGLLEKLD